MKPLSLNLSKMKKVGGDAKHSVFQHPDGHQIKVAHSPLSALQRKQIERMPVHNYAYGSDEVNSSSVNDTEDSSAPVTSPPEESIASKVGSGFRTALGYASDIGPLGMIKGMSALAGSQAAKDFASGFAGSQAQADEPSASTMPQSNSPASVAPSQAPTSAPMPSGVDVNAAYNQGQKAITEQQKVAEQQSKSNADIQQQDLLDREALGKRLKDNTDAFVGQQKQFMNDYANQHIDPKHYLDSMSAPQKIASAIGLILGGAGAGAGRANPALEFLNRQIDRDIESQKVGMDQRKTLMGANQEMFHDQIMAQNQTRMNMNDIYDHKIQLSAAQLGTPQAKAAADAAHAQFAMQNAQLLQQNAIRKTVMDHLGQGGGGLSAIDLAHAGMIPEPDAIKEQASIDAQKSAIQQIQGLYSRLGKVQTLANRVGSPIQSGSDVDALNAEITNAVMGADVSKRLTPESAKLEVLPFHVDLKDNAQTVNHKMMGVLDLVKQHNAGLTPMMNRYSPQSLPKYPSVMSNSLEGKTASDSRGNRIIMQNGRWIPYGG